MSGGLTTECSQFCGPLQRLFPRLRIALCNIWRVTNSTLLTYLLTISLLVFLFQLHTTDYCYCCWSQTEWCAMPCGQWRPLTVSGKCDVHQLGGGAEVGSHLQCTRDSLSLAVPVHRLSVNGPILPSPSNLATSRRLPFLVVSKHPSTPAPFMHRSYSTSLVPLAM